MKILHVMQSVDPAYGGPIEVMVRSEAAWRRLGHSREIASLDCPGDPWATACSIPTHALGCAASRRWAKRLPPMRYGFAPRLVPWLRAHAPGFDAVVVNGLWNYADLAARRVLPGLDKPYFVFTHGMLDPWFRTAHPAKHWAKQLAWWCAEGPLLHGARAVLFTSPGERDAAAGAFRPYRFASAIAGYGIADPPARCASQGDAFRQSVPGLQGDYLLFLGRLHEKKGCDLLIRGFAAVAGRHPELDLVIAGPDAGGLRTSLEHLAASLGVAGRVHWPGMLRGDAKWGALQGCTAFVLPSHGENFGVAVVEALACAKPVLISDKVNIADTIADSGGGLVAPDTIAGTGHAIRSFLGLGPELWAAMGTHARRCFEAHFDIDRVVGRTADLLARAVHA